MLAPGMQERFPCSKKEPKKEASVSASDATPRAWAAPLHHERHRPAHQCTEEPTCSSVSRKFLGSWSPCLAPKPHKALKFPECCC